MDLDEEILSDFSDSEIVESKHKNLVETISSLDKKARLKPASRKEPSLQISEYHLVNKGDEEREQKKLVDVKSLVKSLKQKPSNAHIAKKIAAVHSTSKNPTLQKPLEKIHSDRIEREVAYENVKEDISKWDPIVFDNRTTDQIKFPLKQIDVDSVDEEHKKEKSHHQFLNTFKKPNQLELALAKLLDSSTVVAHYREEKERREQEIRDRRAENKNAEFKLTLQEMQEKQKEFNKLRAQKSFKEKKAWMQNKIKSKKYHRLMKREKVKEKLKEFEKLQKTDPEAALAQLELLDKTRAEERITLRHKSTGQWAKNLQVRAKYDKESRIALAEQLSQSRALSAKVKRDDSSEEEADEDSGVEQDGDEENPWMKKQTEDVSSYFSGYRKYWQEKDKEDEKKKQEEENMSVQPNYGQVSLEKLAGTLDDIDDDIDMPVFIEAANATPTIVPLAKAEEEKDYTSPGEADKESKGNGKNKKRKSRNIKVENILNKSGQWTVIPVEEDEEVTNKDEKIKRKCDKSNGFTNVNGNTSVTISKEICAKERTSISRKEKNEKENSQLNKICDSSDEAPTKKRKNKKKGKQASKLDLSTDLAIDEAFDSLESTWKDQIKQQVKVISNAMSKQAKADREKVTRKKPSEERFDFNDRKKSRKVIDIDEEMNETHEADAGHGEESLKKITELGKQALSSSGSGKPAEDVSSKSPPDQDQIDPNLFLKVDRNTNKLLSRKMPQILQEGALDDDDEEEGGESDEGENTQQMTIEEAFADDDVVQEFRQDKASDAKQSSGQDIDLSLPGWGAWGGPDISKKSSKRRRRRFVIKGVKVARKDDEKPIVIINEDVAQDLKQHLVDEIPHPFTSVKEYEASLRTPLGREWVPELAHRKLTQPAVRTKLGGLIEPIDFESQTRSKLKEYR